MRVAIPRAHPAALPPSGRAQHRLDLSVQHLPQRLRLHVRLRPTPRPSHQEEDIGVQILRQKVYEAEFSEETCRQTSKATTTRKANCKKCKSPWCISIAVYWHQRHGENAAIIMQSTNNLKRKS